MRYASKAHLIEQMESAHAEFLRLAQDVGESRFREPGVWGDGWTVLDLFAHLTEWEQMFLRWFREGRDGQVPALPAPGFTWRETPALNQAIWRKHSGRDVAGVLRDFHESYASISALVRGLDERDVFEPGRFAWTGRNALVTYLGANTASHYRTASKILRRWARGGPRAARATKKADVQRAPARAARARQA